MAKFVCVSVCLPADDCIWSFPPQGLLLQELLQHPRPAGGQRFSHLLWDPVSEPFLTEIIHWSAGRGGVRGDVLDGSCWLVCARFYVFLHSPEQKQSEACFSDSFSMWLARLDINWLC